MDMTVEAQEGRFIDRFRPYGFQKGGILFFTADIAVGVIDEAEKANIPVLGVDAFTVRLNSTQPHMEHSNDVSSLDAGWNEARELIASKKHLGLVFEIVLKK